MSGDARPVFMKWEGDCFVPNGRHWADLCDAQFVVGENYLIEEHHERSGKSHRHYFACIFHAWANLPESLTDSPCAISPEHLRKYALIKTGFCDTQTFPCNTAAEAQRWGKWIRPMDDFAIVTVKGTVVVRHVAKSQSVKAMGKRPFEESKKKVLAYLADLIGVDIASLAATGAEAA